MSMTREDVKKMYGLSPDSAGMIEKYNLTPADKITDDLKEDAARHFVEKIYGRNYGRSIPDQVPYECFNGPVQDLTDDDQDPDFILDMVHSYEIDGEGYTLEEAEAVNMSEVEDVVYELIDSQYAEQFNW